ncbi:hypothetical protein ACGF5C_34210 [Micromonospora sp. NPDC047620]|uniref:hypothetical protein n=1 Tax=Micromonospora sp. NPDC047620 TaxID=3364251 RepID=UPI0037195D14
MNALCVDTVACSGLIGLAGRVLSESDFAVLAQLARVPREALEPHLLSADRFAGGELPVRLDAEVRAALLDRLGLFGVRLATAGAHEFQELRLLAALRNTRLGFDTELAEEARRGRRRPGCPTRRRTRRDQQQLWDVAADAQWNWRNRAEDSSLRLTQRRGAQVVVRSCEGMLAELAEGGR